MDEFTQSMLERARQRREVLAARLATEVSSSARKRPVGTGVENEPVVSATPDCDDDSPNKRQCLKEANCANQFYSPSKTEHLTTNLTGLSPCSASHKSRFAALADSINNWEDDYSPKKRQAPSTPNAKSSVALTSAPPPKPPRIHDMDDEPNDAPLENINPEKSSSTQTTAKYQAPLAPTPGIIKPSVFNNVSVASPVRAPATESLQSSVVASPAKAPAAESGHVSSVVSSPAKAPAAENGHVSSATLVFGSTCVVESPVKVSIAPIKQSPAKTFTGQFTPKTNNTAHKPQASKRNAIPVVEKLINTESVNSSPDTSINEPTKQPVAVRLAAWQSKQVTSEIKEPLPVTSRVKNYEKKVSVADQRVMPKTPIHLRSRTEPVRSPTSKSFSPSGSGNVGRSPSGKNGTLSGVSGRSPAGKAVQSPTAIGRRPSNKAVLEAVAGHSPSRKIGSSPSSKSRIESPLKDGLSPQKLAPATRAVHEKLMQLSETGGKNEVVAREQQQRAAEIAALETRWKSEAPADCDPATMIISSTAAVPPAPPAAPLLPPQDVMSSKRDVQASPRTSNVASPRSAATKDPRRENAREKMRSEFESKLQMMGFDVNSVSNTATADLKKSSANLVLKPARVAEVHLTKLPPATPTSLKTNSTLGLVTPKVTVNSESATLSTSTLCRSSLYSLIKKQQPESSATPSVVNSSVSVPMFKNETQLDDCNVGHDSFDSDDDEEEHVPVVPSKITVKFAEPLDESIDASSVHTSSEIEDCSKEAALAEEDSQCSDDSNHEEDDDERNDLYETEDDEDVDGGVIDDLLEEALTDEPSVEQPVLAKKEKSPEPTARPVSQLSSSGRSSATVRSVHVQDLNSLPCVTMPTTSSGSPGVNKYDKPMRTGDKRQNIVSPRKNQARLMTVMRQSDVSRHAEDDLLPFIPDKPVKQRLQELQDMVNQELNVIQQTSNALNQCCHSNSAFAGSAEAVECHRLLLVACKKRETYMIEMQKLREGLSSVVPSGVQGRLSISDLKLPLKSEFMDKIGTVHDASVFYFIVMIRHASHIIFTQMVSTHDVMVRGSLDFPNLINLNNVTQDFVVDIEVYGMSITRMLETQTPKKKSKVASCTPKKSKHPKLFQSPAGPYAVRTSSFVHVASIQLTKAHLAKTHFALDKVPFSFPLQGSIHLRLNCLMQSNVEESGFLTMFEDVSGFGAWHRRWCVLRNNVIAYWKYPDDEKQKEPIGVIDMKRCITDEVGLVSRDYCARPNTLELKTVRRLQQGEKETLVTSCYETMSTTKHWLSADTKEDRLLWSRRLNEALTNLRAWNSDALRPVKRAT